MDDSSDSYIRFDENGYCNYCTRAIQNIGKIYFPNEEGQKKLAELLSEVKKFGQNKKYDCIMGISGGLDSSYLAYLGAKWGLKVLAVHIDDGYDTEISKLNISRLISATGFDYEVIKPDPIQYNDLTLSYMKAGVPNIAVPQDNILFAFIYKKMREYHMQYFLSGGNFALECILQRGNTHTAYDMDNLIDIHNKFGKEPLDKLEFLSTSQRNVNSRLLGLKSPRPLDYIDYNRDRAFRELKDYCGFEYYGRKHLENILTAFAQLYWFPKKFGVDKRTSHLSSMIVSGQMTREEALRQLSEPLYDEKQMEDYISIIKRNMKISDEEFEAIMSAPTHQHEDYVVER
ncbi:MAG: N-acetyl sugar amidotransferase [Lachnospiraceae bacterium]|nr:N-acetyl sugar amidotransferase [Lachnospiraceae bacterium]